MGVYGFRLDVADELSDDFIKSCKKCLSKGGESILYGEVWEDASNKIAYGKRKEYYLGSELDGVMNYPLRQGIIDYLRNDDIASLQLYFNEILPNAPKRIRDALMNILGSHDTDRIITALAGEKKTGKSADEQFIYTMTKEDLKRGVQLLKTAYTLISALPGIPTIYYGDEAGAQGYSDPFNRKPFPWGKENKNLIKHYRLVGKIRRTTPVLSDGEIKILYFSRKYLIFERYNDYNKIVTVVNNSESELLLSFNSPVLAKIGNYSSKNVILVPKCAEIIDVQAAKNIRIKDAKDF